MHVPHSGATERTLKLIPIGRLSSIFLIEVGQQYLCKFDSMTVCPRCARAVS